jgi:hypothetical protein
MMGVVSGIFLLSEPTFEIKITILHWQSGDRTVSKVTFRWSQRSKGHSSIFHVEISTRTEILHFDTKHDMSAIIFEIDLE